MRDLHTSVTTAQRGTAAKQSSGLSRIIPAGLWTLFALLSATAIWVYPDFPQWEWQQLLRFNGFTLLIWMTVTFFSALVSTYALTYLSGFTYRRRFMVHTLGFTASVMLLLASENLILLIVSWYLMGLMMSRLIGVRLDWKEAQEARLSSQTYFLTSTLFLIVALALPAMLTKSMTITELLANMGSLHYGVLLLSALLLITAAIIQSAIYPFHRWLLSSMTAPTPASALMHAGFVNGAGILLALFAPLVIDADTLTPLFIIGGLTAVIAQFAKLLQVNVKHRLACSTIAQMGFMIMQCGLGFFNAAVAHLILHGFYKAYLFLSAGEGIAQTHPQAPPRIRIKPLQAFYVLICSLAGAWLFTQFTGKGSEVNSGIFLTLIVAIAVGQVTYNIVKQPHIAPAFRILLSPALVFMGIGLYAVVFNGVSQFMSDMPLVSEPHKLTAIQIAFGIIFLAGFFIMKLGFYMKRPWLYVTLMNLTQPFKNTVLKFKNSSL
ncbi:proton-conducting transporter transmembrane domain-containing protein [Robertkochia aurantiaca]|uniref:proton-conducting transporter transmembrane domain-containing protein n=1 Tax=Robertkochia aurantiaca TaxID=2873700 RepID=UPI001CCD4BAE|nr:proton-conducting transporter membrane subunit [Robertkochia sp. 3YJGBD-33]